MVFQDPMSSLNPAFTIGNQVIEAVRLHQKVSRGQARIRAKELLDLVKIPAAEARLARLPARALGRHAPTRARSRSRSRTIPSC